MIKKCLICGIEYKCRDKYDFKIRKFCSRECNGKSMIGMTAWNKGKKGLQVAWNKGKKRPDMVGNTYGFKKGFTPWNKGIPISEECRKMIKQSLTGRKLSLKTRKKISESHMGKKAYQWKGGKTLQNGYVCIYNPGHPNAVKRRTVLEHRLVVEKYINRYLTRKEIVHHINEIKDDNRPENLYLFSNRKGHIVFHHNPYQLISNII